MTLAAHEVEIVHAHSIGGAFTSIHSEFDSAFPDFDLKGLRLLEEQVDSEAGKLTLTGDSSG